MSERQTEQRDQQSDARKRIDAYTDALHRTTGGYSERQMMADLRTVLADADRDRQMVEAVREAFNHATELTDTIEAAHIKHYTRSIYHGSSEAFCFVIGTPCTAKEPR